MSDADLVRWVQARRDAAAREREQLVADPQSAIKSALALVAIAGRLHGWPPRDDPITEREDERARDAWDRVRAVMRSARAAARTAHCSRRCPRCETPFSRCRHPRW